MSTTLCCPNCGQIVCNDGYLGGQFVACPRCGHGFQITPISIAPPILPQECATPVAVFHGIVPHRRRTQRGDSSIGVIAGIFTGVIVLGLIIGYGIVQYQSSATPAMKNRVQKRRVLPNRPLPTTSQEEDPRTGDNRAHDPVATHIEPGSQGFDPAERERAEATKLLNALLSSWSFGDTIADFRSANPVVAQVFLIDWEFNGVRQGYLQSYRVDQWRFANGKHEFTVPARWRTERGEDKSRTLKFSLVHTGDTWSIGGYY